MKTSSIQLTDLITPQRIILGMKADNARQVVEKLSLSAAAEIEVEHKVIRRRILEQEGLTTFGVGRGIALPHASLAELFQPLGYFARLKKPVDFGAADGQPADIVFLLLAPEYEPTLLLRALSCVAGRLRERDVAKRLRAPNSSEATHLILTTDSWRDEKMQSFHEHPARERRQSIV